MRRLVLITLLSVAVAPAAGAQYLEDYFKATAPGSWGTWESRNTDAKGKTETSTQTISRLPDQDGNVVIEVHVPAVPGKKKSKAMTMQMHLKPGFLQEKNPLNFMSHVQRMIMQQEGEPAREMSADMMAMMGGSAASMLDYSQNVTRVGSEEVEGHATTHYQTSGTVQINAMIKKLEYDFASDLWLAESVPFGRVKEHTVMKDSDGKLRSTTDSLLKDHGSSGATSRITGPIEKFEMPKLPFGR